MADFFLDQKGVHFVFIAFEDQRRRSDILRKRIHPFELLAVMGHHFADAPQIVQSHGAIFAPAVALSAFARGHFKVSITNRFALTQDLAHLDNRFCMLATHFANPWGNIAFMAHYYAPVRQLVHRAHRQPAAPVEEFALLVSGSLPHSGFVIQYAAVQSEVVAAGDDLQRVNWHVLQGAHSLLWPPGAPPASPGPQALFAEDETTRDVDVDRQHDGLQYKMKACPAVISRFAPQPLACWAEYPRTARAPSPKTQRTQASRAIRQLVRRFPRDRRKGTWLGYRCLAVTGPARRQAGSAKSTARIRPRRE